MRMQHSSDENDLTLSELTVHLGGTDFFAALRSLYTFEETEGDNRIPELEGSSIADIGSGFSDDMYKLKQILGDKSSITCIDGIYEEKLIQEGLEKAIGNAQKWVVSRTSTSEAVKYYNEKLAFLLEWAKKSKLTYDTKIKESHNIDIAFCKNLFYKIPNPITFIEDILGKVSTGGKIIFIDYGDSGHTKNFRLLHKMESKGLAKKTESNNAIIYTVEKESFLQNIGKIKKLASKTKDTLSIGDLVMPSFGQDFSSIIYGGGLELNTREKELHGFSITISDFNAGNFPNGISDNFRQAILGEKDNIETKGCTSIEFTFYDNSLQWEKIYEQTEGTKEETSVVRTPQKAPPGIGYLVQEVSKLVSGLRGINPHNHLQEFTISLNDLRNGFLPNNISRPFLRELIENKDRLVRTNYAHIEISFDSEGISWQEGEEEEIFEITEFIISKESLQDEFFPDSLSQSSKEEILKLKDRMLAKNYGHFEFAFENGEISWTDWEE